LPSTKNGTFPFWHIPFGTFRLPENRLPDNYGRRNMEFWLCFDQIRNSRAGRPVIWSGVGTIAIGFLNLALTYV
jgi:hypothetical protein